MRGQEAENLFVLQPKERVGETLWQTVLLSPNIYCASQGLIVLPYSVSSRLGSVPYK